MHEGGREGQSVASCSISPMLHEMISSEEQSIQVFFFFFFFETNERKLPLQRKDRNKDPQPVPARG
jgi:hypothetical protein